LGAKSGKIERLVSLGYAAVNCVPWTVHQSGEIKYGLSHAAWAARHGPGIGVWFFHPPVENGDHHMIRAALAIASAAAIGLGAHIAAAQQDPIAARKALMKDNADQAKIGTAMTKGEAPFDLAKVQKIFATFEDTAAKAPALFPEHSIDQPTGG
jgi:Cytochrome C'